jgi:hypothetical protein
MRTRLFGFVLAPLIAVGVVMSAARADEAREMERHTVAPFVSRQFPAMRPHPGELTLKRGHVEIELRNARPARPPRQFCCVFTEPLLDASVVSPEDEAAVQPPATTPEPIRQAKVQTPAEPSVETVGSVTILRGGGAQ